MCEVSQGTPRADIPVAITILSIAIPTTRSRRRKRLANWIASPSIRASTSGPFSIRWKMIPILRNPWRVEPTVYGAVGYRTYHNFGSGDEIMTASPRRRKAQHRPATNTEALEVRKVMGGESRSIARGNRRQSAMCGTVRRWYGRGPSIPKVGTRCIYDDARVLLRHVDLTAEFACWIRETICPTATRSDYDF